MYNNTEEQIFQNFLKQVKEWLPFIIISCSIAVILFYGYRYYENSKISQKQEAYISFNQIIESKDLDTKQILFDKFITNDPKNEFVTFAATDLAQAYLDNKEYQKALDSLIKVENLPGNKDQIDYIKYLKAKLALQLGNNALAIGSLMAINNQSNFYSTSQILLGDIYAEIGDKEKATQIWSALQKNLNLEKEEDKVLNHTIELRITLNK